MGNEKTNPLTVEQAKARLLETLERAEIATLLKQHPYLVLGAAFIAGLSAGRLAGQDIRRLKNILVPMLFSSEDRFSFFTK